MGCACGGSKDANLEYVVTIRGESSEKVFTTKPEARIYAVSIGKGATVVARRKK